MTIEVHVELMASARLLVKVCGQRDADDAVGAAIVAGEAAGPPALRGRPPWTSEAPRYGPF